MPSTSRLDFRLARIPAYVNVDSIVFLARCFLLDSFSSVCIAFALPREGTQINRLFSVGTRGMLMGSRLRLVPYALSLGSVGNLLYTWQPSREAVDASKSSLNLVDVAIQVDLSLEMITYGSEEDLTSRRKASLLRRKKQAPLYSREDIREQYCINSKELEVFNTSRRKGIFSCLSNRQESPCGNVSILSSCVKRKTQDDFHDEEKRPYVKYKPATWRGSSGFGPWMVLDDGIQDSDDPELHFRRRPKTVCLADPRRYYWSSDEETFPLSRTVRPRGGLEGAGLGASMESDDQVPWVQRAPGQPYYRGDDVSYCSADAMSIGSHDAASLRRGAYPPGLATPDFSHLPMLSRAAESGKSIDPIKLAPATVLTSAGEFWERERHETRFSLGSRSKPDTEALFTNYPTETGSMTVLRRGRGAEMTFDERRTKHVSFDNTSLIRSQTLSDIDASHSRRMVMMEGRLGSSPGMQQSQERLLDGRKIPDHLDRSDILGSGSQCSMTKALVQGKCEKMKRSSMRTQATQTESGLQEQSFPPPYLSLSPRMSQKVRKRSTRTQTNGGHRNLVKSHSELGHFEDIQLRVYDLDTGLVKSQDFVIPPPSDLDQLLAAASSTSMEHSCESPLRINPEYREIKRMKEYKEIFIDFQPQEKAKRHVLTKTLSEGDVLCGRKQALTLATGYINVDLDRVKSEPDEDFIERCIVDSEDYTQPAMKQSEEFFAQHRSRSAATGKSDSEEEFHESYFIDTYSDTYIKEEEEDEDVASSESSAKKQQESWDQSTVSSSVVTESLSEDRAIDTWRGAVTTVQTWEEKHGPWETIPGHPLSTEESEVSHPPAQAQYSFSSESVKSHFSSDSELRTFDPHELSQDQEEEYLDEELLPELTRIHRETRPEIRAISPQEAVFILESAGDRMSEPPTLREPVDESVTSDSLVTVIQRHPMKQLSVDSAKLLSDSETMVSISEFGSLQSTGMHSSVETLVKNGAFEASKSEDEPDLDYIALDRDVTSPVEASSPPRSETLPKKESPTREGWHVEEAKPPTTVSRPPLPPKPEKVRDTLRQKKKGTASKSPDSTITSNDSPKKSPHHHLTSLGGLSRTDSGKTEISETSEEYVTATDHSTTSSSKKSGKALKSEEGYYTPIEGDSKDSSKAEKPDSSTITAPDIDSSMLTSSETIQDIHEEPLAEILSPGPESSSSSSSSGSYAIEPSPGSQKKSSSPSIPHTIEESGQEVEEASTEPQYVSPSTVRRRKHAERERDDETKRYSKYLEEGTEERGEREKLKLGMKLDLWDTGSSRPSGWPKVDLSTGEVQDRVRSYNGRSGGEDMGARPRSYPTDKKSKSEDERRRDDIPRTRKDRRKQVTSLGMVRSPAMHEGFRPELFTVERSPQTPKEYSSTSSDSEEVKQRSERRRRRRYSRETPEERNRKGKNKSRSSSRDGPEQPGTLSLDRRKRKDDPGSNGVPVTSSLDRRKKDLVRRRTLEREDAVDYGSDSVPKEKGREGPRKNGNGKVKQVRIRLRSSEDEEKPDKESSIEARRQSLPSNIMNAKRIHRKGEQSDSFEGHEVLFDPAQSHLQVNPEDTIQRLGLSYESLHSVSAGSDSVFFQSESVEEIRQDLANGKKNGTQAEIETKSEIASIQTEALDLDTFEKARSPSDEQSEEFIAQSISEPITPPENFTNGASTSTLVHSSSEPGILVDHSEGSPSGTLSRAAETQTGRSLKKKKHLVPELHVLLPLGPDIPEEETAAKRKKTRVRSEERATPPIVSKDTRAKSEERSLEERLRKPRKSSLDSSPDSFSRGRMSSNSSIRSSSIDICFEDEEESGAVYAECYKSMSWVYIGERREEEELKAQPSKEPVDRVASTGSEKEFSKKYQAITHRMIHRRATAHMFERIQDKRFECDRKVVVQRVSGEFGFRIHGSRPVVVSAIEPGTPAESSGLRLGDVIIAINGVSVLDSSHAEVVRIAHSGSDILTLEIARTTLIMSPILGDQAATTIHSGYLYRRSGSSGTLRWHKRWFLLKSDACLYFSKSEKDQTPLGAFSVLGYSVQANPEQDQPFAFSVGRAGSVVHWLAATSLDSMQAWIQALKDLAMSGKEDPWLERQILSLGASATSIQDADCFGYLSKLGHKWRAWRRRYCVLKDGLMFFFSESNADSALGGVCLHGYRVQSSAVGGKKHAFELVPPDSRFRQFYFYTDSDTDKKRWVAALEYSIDRWLKVS
ncbi:unnamed protein product [Darwinula stevensoni]|uniref:Uncharacterized protein n=1 Tax=Darwinula stevensoni TaxID=69355 RepID=A0A7R8WZA8_9CRUS|nr:unnamed protein product [Darwinula stevensoni]CAG0880351.1 unnamed protein product [Darwinula stevensoni]